MTTPNDNTPEHRSIELEVEVPGTPEQLWEAIATGPGIAAWFVPAGVAGREGGSVSFDMGSGMEESGVVTAWDPPRRFAYEEEWPVFEDTAPAQLSTEWIVEPRSGGTCVVHLVSSVFASGDEWDRELENMRDGWGVYLHNLRLYCTHFPGQRCSWILVKGNAPGPQDRGWAAMTDALGLPEATLGERASASAPGAPPLAGFVEWVADGEHHRGLMLRIDEPAPGVAIVFVYSWRDRVYTNVHAYLFGDEAPAVTARDAPAWRAWMDEHFPSAESATETGAATG